MPPITPPGDRGGNPPADQQIAEVVAAFQRGIDCEENFEWLVARFYGPVYRFLSRWHLSDDDRLDITQEVFIKVYKNLPAFRGDAHFGTWVFSIAFNTCMGWLKKEPPARTGDDRDAPDSDEVHARTLRTRAAALLDDQLDHLIARECIVRLREAIAELPPQMRRCVQLQIDQDLRLHEIAAILQLSTGAVKAHLFQAREKLRAHLGAPLAGDRPP